MDYLRDLLIEHGKTQTELAQILERDKSAITNLLQGKRQLKADEVVKISQFLNVSVDEVLGLGKPVKHRSDDMYRGGGEDEFVWIPFQNKPSQDLLGHDQVTQEGDYYYLFDGSAATEKTYAIEVTSNALILSGFLIGDIAISELDRPIEPGDIVVVQHFNNNVSETLLRIYQPPFLVPHSSNPEFKRLHEERANVRMISPVTRVVRLLK
ncbi:MAG: helix-turn-helix domain-containing protein [Rickettsiales bacterium]|nr:helix-turn-helix domain-containing protein [Rickettsiales bacterium]